VFKNVILYRIAGMPALDVAFMEERAADRAFVECGPTQAESVGWVPPRGDDHGALIEAVGGELVMRIQREAKAVPGAVLKRELQKRLDKIEADTGRRPKGKAAKELKADLVHELLPRAFGKRSAAPVWISRERRLIVIGAGSIKASDFVASMLVELLGGGVSLTLVQLARNPAQAMATWLAEREAPAGFTLDRECELKQPDSEKAAVRYTRHTLDIEEVREHIRQGKLPTKVAMTWNGRVSFVLTEAFTLKSVKVLDVAFGEGGATDENYDAFDADVAITTGELAGLVPALVDAIGGEAAPDLVAQATAAATPAAHTGEGPDPLVAQARSIVLAQGRASISLVQRHLRIGYNRAARLLEALEAQGVVSAMDTKGNREVLEATA
jgi:recombination associated protein RdgC